MAAIAPLAVTFSTAQPTWDDAYFLERAACVSRSAFDLSLRGVGHCMAGVFKSPLMTLLLLPAGHSIHETGQLGVATFILACCTFALAVWLAWITFRAGTPLAAVLAAALAIGLCGPIQIAGAPFLVDGAFALLVVIALLLPVLEIGNRVMPGRASVQRGLLWGAVFSLGFLSKTTFCMFAALTAPLLVFASFRRSGWCATREKVLAALFVGVLPGLMFIRYGSLYIGNAWRSSFGDLAKLYGSEKSFWQSLSEIVATAGVAYWTICAGLLAVAILAARRNPERLLIALGSIAIALGYLSLVSISQNAQPRFLWSVWLALPVLAAAAIVPHFANSAPDGRIAISFICIAVVLASAPMVSRFDFGSVREGQALLRSLKSERPVSLVIASDPPFFNINTLLLAQQLEWSQLRGINVRTVVYDKAEGRNVQHSEQQLLAADFIVISEPDSIATGPEFTNSLLSHFLSIARTCGRLIEKHPGPVNLSLFDMRDTSCLRPQSSK